MAGIPLAMWIARTAGSAKCLFLGALSILFLPLCGTKYLFWGAICLGFTCGVLDLSNSSHAICLEKLLKSKIVGSMLAMNSFGNILGVLIGGVCDYCNVTPFLHFIVLSAAGSILSVQFFTFLVDFETEKFIMMNDRTFSTEESLEEEDLMKDECNELPSFSVGEKDSFAGIVNISLTGPSYRSFGDATCNDEITRADYVDKYSPKMMMKGDVLCGCHPQLLYICLIAFVNMMGVSSVNNWCTIYFSSILKTSPFLSSIGYATFELFVMIGQVTSDTLMLKMGSLNILKWAGITASFGMFVVVIAPSFPKLVGVPIELQSCSLNWQCAQIGVIGYAITGLGLSFVSPMLVSYTGKLKLPLITSTGQIGRLTGSSYLGILVSPFIFGELSMALSGLRWALLSGALAMTTIPVLASFAFQNEVIAI